MSYLKTDYITPYFHELTESVSPAYEPVTIKTVKEYLGISHDGENNTLNLLIAASRAIVEATINKSIINRTLLAKFQGYEKSYPLPMGPVNSITTVTKVVGDTSTVLTEGTGYEVQGYTYDKTIKLTNYTSGSNANVIPEVHVLYTAGMGATPSAIPSNIRLAVLEQIKYVYEAKDEFNRISSQSSGNAKDMILPSIRPRVKEYLQEYIEYNW